MRELSFLSKIKFIFMQKISLLIFKFPEIFKQKKYLFFVIVLAVIGLSFPTNSVHAFWEEAASGVMNYLIYPLVYVIFYILFYVAYVIAQIGASLISANLNPDLMNSVLTSSSIEQGWRIFRDVANLLFILILLLVAFGTMFRSDTYNIKKSLPKIILVAFLINFSMMITGVIIDFTNILMYGVLKMMCTAGDNQCFQNFYRQLMGSVDSLYNTYTLTGGVTWQGISVQSAVGMAVATIYTFVFGIILMALAVFLLIRIAAFALLIILSPLAFFGEITPGLKGLSNKWWDNLWQYAFFGPIFALLLYIAGLMSEAALTVGTSSITTNPNLGVFSELFATIITNIIPLIFLLSIIPITRSIGIAGASAIYAGAAVATFGGMAVVGKAWGEGKLFPGQQRITNAGNKIGGWASRQALKNQWIKGKWSGVPRRAGQRYLGGYTPGLKGHLENAKDKLKSQARGIGGGKAGDAYDWAAAQREKREKQLFGETKTLGQYAEMGIRSVNPVLLEMKYKDWLKNAYHENYKIPLGASPDEKRKIKLMEANKSVSELKSAGGFDNPERVSDKAAEEFAKGNNLTFEILTKLLGAQDKQLKVLSSINRNRGLADDAPGAFAPNAQGWAQFLNYYKDKVGENQASNFGQEIGTLARKEGNWTAENIAYYDKNTGANKIRDIGTDGRRNDDQMKAYKIYIEENAKAMDKASQRTRLNNASHENFVNKEGKFNPLGAQFFGSSLTKQELKDKFKNMSTATLRSLSEANGKMFDSDWNSIFEINNVTNEGIKAKMRANAKDVSERATKVLSGDAESGFDDSSPT